MVEKPEAADSEMEGIRYPWIAVFALVCYNRPANSELIWREFVRFK